LYAALVRRTSPSGNATRPIGVRVLIPRQFCCRETATRHSSGHGMSDSAGSPHPCYSRIKAS